MDYIQQLNAFELWCETNYLPGVSQLIWYKLFMLFNRCGWAEWVTVDNFRLMALADLKSETTFINNRDKLIESGLVKYQKGKKGSPNRYKMIMLYTPKNEVENINTPKNGVNTESKRSENDSQNGVNSIDINKLNETKPNETIDMSNDISPVGYRQRYTAEQLKVIDAFFDILKHTRKSARLADSVVLGIYQDWDKHEPQKVLYALHKYVHEPSLHDKKENYVLGIIRNTTAADIEQYKSGYKKEPLKQSVKKNRFVNFQGRNNDYSEIERLEQEYIDEKLFGGKEEP